MYNTKSIIIYFYFISDEQRPRCHEHALRAQRYADICRTNLSECDPIDQTKSSPTNLKIYKQTIKKQISNNKRILSTVRLEIGDCDRFADKELVRSVCFESLLKQLCKSNKRTIQELDTSRFLINQQSISITHNILLLFNKQTQQTFSLLPSGMRNDGPKPLVKSSQISRIS